MRWPGSAIRGRFLRSEVYYGWFVVAVCFLLAMMTMGVIYSFSVFFGYILATFEQSHANTSIVFGLQSIVTFGGAAVLGIVIDRYGARRLLPVAGVLVVSGLVGASRLGSFHGVAVSYGVVAAAGFAITYVVAFASVPRWFERRRGMATGIATTGSGVGILAMPPFASVLINEFGWRNAYLGLAGMFLLVLLVGILVIRDRPGDLDLAPSTEFEDGIPSSDTRGWRQQLDEIRAIVTTRAFQFVILGFFFAYVPTYVLLVYLVEFTATVGVARRVGVLGISIIGAMNIGGKLLAGPVADRTGTARTITACAGLMGVATMSLAVLHVPWSILGLAFVFGLGYGGISALLSPIIADLFGTLDLNALFGVSSIAFAIAGSVVPYLVGFTYDSTGTYLPALMVGGVLGVTGGGFLLIAARRHMRLA